MQWWKAKRKLVFLKTTTTNPLKYKMLRIENKKICGMKTIVSVALNN